MVQVTSKIPSSGVVNLAAPTSTIFLSILLPKKIIYLNTSLLFIGLILFNDSNNHSTIQRKNELDELTEIINNTNSKYVYKILDKTMSMCVS